MSLSLITSCNILKTWVLNYCLIVTNYQTTFQSSFPEPEIFSSWDFSSRPSWHWEVNDLRNDSEQRNSCSIEKKMKASKQSGCEGLPGNLLRVSNFVETIRQVVCLHCLPAKLEEIRFAIFRPRPRRCFSREKGGNFDFRDRNQFLTTGYTVTQSASDSRCRWKLAPPPEGAFEIE